MSLVFLMTAGSGNAYILLKQFYYARKLQHVGVQKRGAKKLRGVTDCFVYVQESI